MINCGSVLTGLGILKALKGAIYFFEGLHVNVMSMSVSDNVDCTLKCYFFMAFSPIMPLLRLESLLFQDRCAG